MWSFGVNRVSKPKKRKLLLPHIPFAIALNTIGRETGDGIPGASTAKTTSLGITCQPPPLPFDLAAPSDRGFNTRWRQGIQNVLLILCFVTFVHVVLMFFL